MKLTLRLRADDDARTRAAKIMAYCAMTEGDPKLLDGIMRHMTECLEKYMEADGVRYDPHVDSYRSWQAAVAAIREGRR